LKFNYAPDCFPPVDFKIGPLIICNVLFCLNKIKTKIVASHNEKKNITLDSYPSEGLENLMHEQNGL